MESDVVLDVLRIIVQLRLFELLNLFLHFLLRGVELLNVDLRCELGLLVVIFRAGGILRLVVTTIAGSLRLFFLGVPRHLLGLALAGRRRVLGLLDVHGRTVLPPAH